MNKVELLAPAGNFSKFLTAIQFGADAVYIGGKTFSLRALSENFTPEEIVKAAQIAHESNKKLYVAVNIFAKNADLKPAAEYFAFLKKANVKAGFFILGKLVQATVSALLCYFSCLLFL